MNFELALQPPMLTSNLPGIGGSLKQHPEDFEVEEIPAYAPSGEGEFLYLWVEKRDIGAQYFMRQVAQRLGISNNDIGSAGLKDRKAVTRQWVSVPASAETKLAALDGDGIRVLDAKRHSNKLRTGHLRGNTFRVLVRDAVADSASLLTPLLARIRDHGLINYYGPQRFGRVGETFHLGMAQLQGTSRGPRNPFLKKLSLSAVQSALFNLYLERRLGDGLLRTVMAGDVMGKLPFGGMFTAENLNEEQPRFDRREIVTQGPIFGSKMFPAKAEAAAREEAVLTDANLSRNSFAGFGKLLQGTRRHNLIYVDDLAYEPRAEGIRFQFTLPAGSYATVLLREVMKRELEDGETDGV